MQDLADNGCSIAFYFVHEVLELDGATAKLLDLGAELCERARAREG